MILHTSENIISRMTSSSPVAHYELNLYITEKKVDDHVLPNEKAEDVRLQL